VGGKIFLIDSFSNQKGKEGLIGGYLFKNWFAGLQIIPLCK
jgi:hypothetical protein